MFSDYLRNLTKKLPNSKIKFCGFATLDRFGRVFTYKQKIYRGIYPDQVEEVHALLDSGLIDRLTQEQLFVKTVKTDYFSSEFPLILEHERLTSSLPTDWSLSMLKDAAHTILRTNEICNEYGFELSDAHPYNICFRQTQPLWVDLGSIRKQKFDYWEARKEFIESLIVPLTFIAHDELLLGYSLLQAGRTFKLDTKPFDQSHMYSQFLKLIKKSRTSVNSQSINHQWLEDLCTTARSTSTYWSQYQNDSVTIAQDLKKHRKNRFNRFFKLPALITQFAPDARTAVDLAGNAGIASLILTSRGNFSKIINTDYDSIAIDESYKFLKLHPEFKVESYLLNFMLPMQQESITHYKSDLALALAITHHLLLTQKFKVSGVFEKIKEYTNKYVFIEFMPLGLWGGDPIHKPEVPTWYTAQWFEAEFKKHFTLLHIEVLESHVINKKREPHRVLFIGKI